MLAVYREGIDAHLTAAIATAETSPGGLLMPNQSLLIRRTGVGTDLQLPQMMHRARELCGGQICITLDFGHLRCARGPAVAGEVLLDHRRMAGRRPAQAAGLRPRSAQQRLRRAPAHLPIVRPGSAVRALLRPSTATSTSTARCGMVKAAAELSDRVNGGVPA